MDMAKFAYMVNIGYNFQNKTITLKANEVPLPASGGQYSFTMGEEDFNITQKEIVLEWKSGTAICRLDSNTFTVSPTADGGEMTNYTQEEDSPWYAFRDEIENIVFENGITRIGEKAFAQCQHINTITIPLSLSMTHIGQQAFYDCVANDVYCYPAAQNLQIEKNVFMNMPRWHVFSNQ